MNILKTLSSLVLVSFFIVKSSYGQKLEGWNKLSPAEERTWTNGVSLWFANQFNTPESEYHFYTKLDKQLKEKVELSTSETARLQNAISLESSLKFKRNEIKESQQLNEVELKDWAEKRKESYSTTESVNLQTIFVRKFDLESSATALKRAEKALKRIQGGESFGIVAYETSDARSAAINGSAGTITRGKISPELEKVAFSSPLNKIIGPVETPRGYYLLKVTGINKPFSLENDSDRKKAKSDLLNYNVNQAMAKLDESWREKNKPVVLKEPKDKQDWLNQPWIKYGEGNTVPFYHLYFRLSQMDMNLASPGEWSDFYNEEAGIAASDVILGLASSANLAESVPVRKVAELATPAYLTMEKLRAWYAKLIPSDADLKSFFEMQKSKMSSTFTYDFVAWYTPVDLTTTSGKPLDSEELAEKFTKTLNKVDAYISSKDKESRTDVEKLLGEMRREFANSRVTSDTGVQSVSPFMDPVLSRTDVKKLSRPFDAGKEIAIIYILNKKKSEIPLTTVKGSLVESWRQSKLNELVKSVKKEAGIKE